MKMLRMCLNPKVLLALAAAGVAVWLLAPGALAAALPLLLLAACPLSMVLMMAMMHRPGSQTEPPVTRVANERDIRAELTALQARQSQLLSQLERRPEDVTAP